MQMLFEQRGSTFTWFVIVQRLMAAHKVLTARADMPINTIAYDLGFNDISNFNRAFRQRYGCSPSDIRKGAVHAMMEREVKGGRKRS
jgi:AraC-like DNA-binding protein